MRTASNGRDAMDMLVTGLRPCVILLDLMMPLLNGWDFRVQQLLAPELAGIPLALISGCGFSAASIGAQFPGVEFLDKPISLPRLLQFVHRHCPECGGQS